MKYKQKKLDKLAKRNTFLKSMTGKSLQKEEDGKAYERYFAQASKF